MSKTSKNSCETAIKNTLAYRAVFKYSLSYYQLYATLVSDRNFTPQYFSDELKKLVKKGEVKSRYGRYFAPGFKPVNYAERTKISRELIRKNDYVFKILAQIPWIQFLGVTGSAAAFNATKDSDVDIFVITSPNRLWVTRGFTALILKVLNKHPNKNGDAGKICPNLFIDGSELSWPKKKQSLYTAHEIALMYPIINKNDTYFKFVNANRWVHKYLANFTVIYSSKANEKTTELSKFMNLAEKLAMKMELKYMRAKKTKEVTTSKMIHFNKNDNSDWILNKFKEFSH